MGDGVGIRVMGWDSAGGEGWLMISGFHSFFRNFFYSVIFSVNLTVLLRHTSSQKDHTK